MIDWTQYMHRPKSAKSILLPYNDDDSPLYCLPRNTFHKPYTIHISANTADEKSVEVHEIPTGRRGVWEWYTVTAQVKPDGGLNYGVDLLHSEVNFEFSTPPNESGLPMHLGIWVKHGNGDVLFCRGIVPEDHGYWGTFVFEAMLRGDRGLDVRRVRVLCAADENGVPLDPDS